MRVSQALPVVLGTFAVASGAALLSCNTIFAIQLSRTNSTIVPKIPGYVASGLGLAAAILLTLLLGRQIRYRNGAHLQDIGRGPQYTYLLAGFSAVICSISAVATAVFLGLMGGKLDHVPAKIILSSTRSLIVGAFIIWAMTLIAQGLFIICIVIVQKRVVEHGSLFDVEASADSEIKESDRPHSQTPSGTREEREIDSSDSRSSPSSGRSRSETFSSFRSSISGVVRPTTSKSRLVSPGQKPSQTPHRPTSIDSGYRETVLSIEDGFDSWDTSAVDPQTRQAVMESGSPTPAKFPLETIPASPTTSRSPSPGFPLDLEPPRARTRSRSYSPANSFVERRRETRAGSPTPSTAEAHIHPLFRTDSPEPPPAATPGTIITAAPTAGQVISTRSSVRSLRMRSGSYPASPLVHSDSLDSIRRAMEREDAEEAGGERSLTGYSSRRRRDTLDKVGETGEN